MSSHRNRAAARQAASGLKDLLNRAGQGLNRLLDLIAPSPRPAVQPVPVRSPRRQSHKPVRQG